MHAYITCLHCFDDPSRHALPVHVTAQPKDVRFAMSANSKGAQMKVPNIVP